MPTSMTAQLIPHAFQPFGPNSIFGLLSKTKLACGTNGIHEREAMWHLHLNMKKSTFSALRIRLASKNKAETKVGRTEKSTALTKHLQVLNCLLQTYATDENIADRIEEIITFIEPSNKAPLQYARELVPKTFRSEDFYAELCLNGNILEGTRQVHQA